MDRTEAINVAFLAGVVIILVAAFVYVNVCYEEHSMRSMRTPEHRRPSSRPSPTPNRVVEDPNGLRATFSLQSYHSGNHFG